MSDPTELRAFTSKLAGEMLQSDDEIITRLRAERDQEKAWRIEYQDIVYAACNFFDHGPKGRILKDDLIDEIRAERKKHWARAEELEKAEAENERLRGLVPRAFREGWEKRTINMGRNWHPAKPADSWPNWWPESHAARELAEKGGG